MRSTLLVGNEFKENSQLNKTNARTGILLYQGRAKKGRNRKEKKKKH